MNNASAFADVLEDVALQLSSLNPQTESPEDIAATAARVMAEYQRIRSAAQQFGMGGVYQAAEWVHGMLVSFQQDLPDAILELLYGGQLFGWIELTAVALREPEDSSHLPAIAAELMDDAWPEPPAPDMLENLLVNLRVSSQQDSATDSNIPPSETGTQPLSLGG